MMTDSDLRALFADEASDISEPADLLARLTVNQSPPRATRTRRWRGWVAPVAAAAAVVTVVSLATALSGTRQQTDAGAGGHTLPVMPGRDLGYTITVGAVSGYDTSATYLSSDRETTDVKLSDGRGVLAGEVVAYPPGGFDPTAVRRGQPVTVQGHQGYFGASTSSADQVDHVANPTRPATLAWEAAPDRWIVVQGWDAAASPPLQARHLDPLTEEMRVAQAVDTSTTKPLLLPYRVGYLPAGLRHGGGRATFRGDDWSSYLWFLGVGQTGSAPYPPGLAITAFPKGDASGPVDGSLTIDGHPAQFRPAGRAGATTGKPPLPKAREVSTLTVDFGSAVVVIAGAYSQDELVRIAQSITIADDVNNPSTWFDAAK
jgi:hypothetical protein